MMKLQKLFIRNFKFLFLLSLIAIYQCKTTTNKTTNPTQEFKDSSTTPEKNILYESKSDSVNKGARIKNAIKKFIDQNESDPEKGIFQKELLNEVTKMDDSALTSIIESDPEDRRQKTEMAHKIIDNQIHTARKSNQVRPSDDRLKPTTFESETPLDGTNTETSDKETESLLTSAIFLGTCVISGTWGLATVKDFHKFNYKGHAAVQVAAAIGFFLAAGAWFDDTFKDDEYILFGVAAIMEGTIAVSVYRDLIKRKIFKVKNALIKTKSLKQLPASSSLPNQEPHKKAIDTPQIERQADADNPKPNTYLDEITEKGKKVWGSSKFWMAWGAYEAITGALYIKKALSDGFQLTFSQSKLTPEQQLLSEISRIISAPDTEETSEPTN